MSNPSLAFNPKKTSPRPLASTILLSSSLPPLAGRPPAIARLVPATLLIAPAPAAPSARVRVSHVYTAGLRPFVIPPRHHHAGAARHLSHHEITSGIAGVEGTTAAAHRRGGTPTTLVADAGQAHVAPEKAAHCPASGRSLLSVENGVSGNRNRGAENGRGNAKGHLAGAGGARVCVDATTKVRATCSRFNPDNISCERDKIVQFRSAGQRRISSEEVFPVTMLHLHSICPR